MNSNMTDHERAARMRKKRRSIDHIATAALTRIRQTDRDTASMLDGYIAILTAEANAYAAAAEARKDTGSEASASSRVDAAEGVRSGGHEIGGLSTRRPHTVRNTGIEGADLLD